MDADDGGGVKGRRRVPMPRDIDGIPMANAADLDEEDYVVTEHAGVIMKTGLSRRVRLGEWFSSGIVAYGGWATWLAQWVTRVWRAELTFELRPEQRLGIMANGPLLQWQIQVGLVLVGLHIRGRWLPPGPVIDYAHREELPQIVEDASLGRPQPEGLDTDRFPKSGEPLVESVHDDAEGDSDGADGADDGEE